MTGALTVLLAIPDEVRSPSRNRLRSVIVLPAFGLTYRAHSGGCQRPLKPGSPAFPVQSMAVSGPDEHVGGTSLPFRRPVLSKRLLPVSPLRGPTPPGLAVVQVLPTPDRVTIVAQPRSPTAACPDCGTLSRSVHSHYERHLEDLPWQGDPAALRIRARRVRCPAPACHPAGLRRTPGRRSRRRSTTHQTVG